MNNGRQQHLGLHHPQHAGMQNAPPPRDESIMQQRKIGRFDGKFEHSEQRATKNENGVSGSSRNYAWEQQPSAYLRHSYDLEFNSGTKDHGVCVCSMSMSSQNTLPPPPRPTTGVIDPRPGLLISCRTSPSINTTASITVEDIVTRPFQHAVQKPSPPSTW